MTLLKEIVFLEPTNNLRSFVQDKFEFEIEQIESQKIDKVN
jgi:hypothetical protein